MTEPLGAHQAILLMVVILHVMQTYEWKPRRGLVVCHTGVGCAAARCMLGLI